MMKRKSNTKNFLNRSFGAYILLGAWILLLAITDYSSWLSGYHKFLGNTYPPVPSILSVTILFLPIVILALYLSYFQASSESASDTQKNSLTRVINFIAIVALSWLFYFLLRALLHGIF